MKIYQKRPYDYLVLIGIFIAALILAVASKSQGSPMECLSATGTYHVYAECDQNGWLYMNTLTTLTEMASGTVYPTDENTGERWNIDTNGEGEVNVKTATATIGFIADYQTPSVIADVLNGTINALFSVLTDGDDIAAIDSDGNQNVAIASGTDVAGVTNGIVYNGLNTTLSDGVDMALVDGAGHLMVNSGVATNTKIFIADYQTPDVMADVLNGAINAVYSAITDGTDTAAIDGSGNFGVNINNATGMFIVDMLTAEPVDIDTNGDMEVNVKTATRTITFTADWENPEYILQINSSGHITGIATVAAVTTVSTVTSVTENASGTFQQRDDGSSFDVNATGGTIDTVTGVTTVSTVTQVASSTVQQRDDGSSFNVTSTGGTIDTITSVASGTFQQRDDGSSFNVAATGGTIDTVTGVTTVSTVTQVASSTVQQRDDGSSFNVAATGGTIDTVTGVTTVSTVTAVASGTFQQRDDGSTFRVSGTVTPTRLSTYEYDNPTIGAGAEAAVTAAATSYVVSVFNGGADPIFVKLSGTAANDDGLEIPTGNGKTWENVSTSAISVYNSGAAGADIAVEWRR